MPDDLPESVAVRDWTVGYGNIDMIDEDGVASEPIVVIYVTDVTDRAGALLFPAHMSGALSTHVRLVGEQAIRKFRPREWRSERRHRRWSMVILVAVVCAFGALGGVSAMSEGPVEAVGVGLTQALVLVGMLALMTVGLDWRRRRRLERNLLASEALQEARRHEP